MDFASGMLNDSPKLSRLVIERLKGCLLLSTRRQCENDSLHSSEAEVLIRCSASEKLRLFVAARGIQHKREIFRYYFVPLHLQHSNMHPDLETKVQIDRSRDARCAAFGVKNITNFRHNSLAEFRVIVLRNELRVVKAPAIRLDVARRKERYSAVK